MNQKVKTITVLVLLSFTCFLTQCEGCLKKDRLTDKLLPDQVIYTVSCGFPAPYFDVEILNAADESYYYRVKGTGMAGVSVTVNIIVIIALYALIVYLASGGVIILNRFINVTLVLILLFNSALLLPYYPEILRNITLYLYVYPVMLINNLLEFFKIETYKQNLSPRVYFALLIILFYFSVPLKNVIFKKKAEG